MITTRRSRARMRGRVFLAFTALVIAALATGCASAGRATYAAPESPKYRIAIAQFAQETNSFSPVLTTLDNFRAGGIYRGPEVLTYAEDGDNALSGFLAAVDDFGERSVEIVPVLKATAVSGGPLERGTYEQFRDEIVDGIRNAGQLDGVYLALHGAMGVDGIRDPEGDLLAAIREVTGDSIPIGVSFDLHANVTERRAELATFIVGYHTNPHRDFFDTGYRSGEILVRTVQGQVDPVMVVRKMRMLKGGGMNIDFLSPMRSVFREMDRMEKRDGVLSVSNFMVHIWLDDPELGWSTVAVTDGNADLAAAVADELADLDWEVRDVPHAATLTAEEAVVAARKAPLARAFGTTIICDASDAVGAGAPGENAWILKAFMENDPDLRVYLPLRSVAAVAAAWDVPVGETASVTVGREFETIYNTSVDFTGRVDLKTETEAYGRIVVLVDRGMHLILTELPVTASKPDFFKDLGLPPRTAGVVVVKNLFPFRFNYLAVNRKTLNVMTPGTTSVDVWELQYEQIPRPIYPLDEIESWRVIQ